MGPYERKYSVLCKVKCLDTDSHFVRIPRSCLEQFTLSVANVSIVEIELLDGSQRKIFASVGGLSNDSDGHVIEVGRSIGLPACQTVALHPPRGEELGLADLVEVAPLDSGDWDIIRLNQSEVQRAVLEQLRLIQPNSIFSLLVGSLTVRLRVISVRPSKAAVVLQPMTQLGIIAPPHADIDEPPDFDWPASEAQSDFIPEVEKLERGEKGSSSWLPTWLTKVLDWPSTDKTVKTKIDQERAQFESSFLSTKLSTVLRVQERLPDVDGLSSGFSCLISNTLLGSEEQAQTRAFFALLQVIPRPAAENRSANAESSNRRIPILAEVRDDLPADRIFLPPAFLLWKRLEVGAPVYLESMSKSDHCCSESVAKQIVLATTIKSEALLSSVKESLEAILASKWHLLPGSWPLLLDNKLFEVSTTPPPEEFAFILPSAEVKTEVATSSLIEIKRDSLKPFHAGLSISSMAFFCPSLHSEQLTTCLAHLWHCLRLENPWARPAHLVVTGEPGVGKTVFLQRLAAELGNSRHAVVSQLLNCVLLRGKRSEVIRKRIDEALADLSWRRPALLLLDNLDSIVPDQEGTDSGSGEALSPGSSLALSLKTLLDNLTDSDKGRVVVVASASSMHSLSAELQPGKGSVVFPKMVVLQRPSRQEREQLTKTFLGSNLLLSEDFLRATESFTAGDLERWARRFKAKFGTLSDIITSMQMISDVQSFIPLGRWSHPLRPQMSRSLTDVGGLVSPKRILVETLIWPTSYATIYKAVGVRLPRGILLYGIPGTGKTLLAESIAFSSGLNYIPVKGPELLSKYIGASEANIREVFRRAEAARPCLIFFDEFESLAPRRGHDSTGVTDRVVNQLLTQLDGVEGLAEGVWILAATSRPDLVDPALLRPGRIDKSILCPMPSEEDRLDILSKLIRDMNVDSDVELGPVARVTEGLTGADLKALLYTAQLGETETPSTLTQILPTKLLPGEARSLQQKILEKTRKCERPADLYARSRDDPMIVPSRDNLAVTQPRGDLMLTQESLMRAAILTKPSVSQTDLQKFQTIYSAFESGRRQPSTGQRSTLA